MAETTQISEEEFQRRIEEYNLFLRGLELVHIALERVEAVQHPELLMTENLRVDIVTKSKYEYEDGKMKITSHFKVVAKNKKKHALKVEGMYFLLYNSEQPVTDFLFGLYNEDVLPLNIWPFMRELVHSMTIRMGLPPLTLPLTIQ